MRSLQLGVSPLKVMLQHSMGRTDLMLPKARVLQQAANFMFRILQQDRVAAVKVIRQISNHKIMSSISNEQCIGSAKRIGNWIAPPQAGSLELQAIDYQLLAFFVRFA